MLVTVNKKRERREEKGSAEGWEDQNEEASRVTLQI